MDKKDFYIKTRLRSKTGVYRYYNIHPVIHAIIEGGYALMEDKRHFFGIITGNVGDGKSNLAAQLTALWEKKNKRHMDWDNIVWTTKKFIEKTDRGDNFTKAIWWDEAITGATGRNSITIEGDMLKISIVTKRFKKHFYLLIVDEVEEYSWKLIKMANFWIHVHTNYNERGYFKCWTSKRKIKQIYQAFKYYKWDWSRINTYPDMVGRFFNYLPSLLDEGEYDRKKLEETQVQDKTKKNNKFSSNDIQRYMEIKSKRDTGLKWSECGGDTNRIWYTRFEKRISNKEEEDIV
jgi:hypothetical protein